MICDILVVGAGGRGRRGIGARTAGLGIGT